LESRSWVPITGRITSITPSHWRSYGPPLPITRLEYSYTVGGASFTSSNVGGDSDTFLEALLSAGQEVDVGSTVTAYYDAADPQQAVLRRGVGFREWLAVVTPVLGLGLLAQWSGILRALWPQ
jgi:hypothetical protein